MDPLKTIRTHLCDQTKWTRLEGGQLTSFDKPKLTLWDWILHHLGISSVPSKATFTELNTHIVSSLSDTAELSDVQAIKSRLQALSEKTTTQKGAFSEALGALQTWEANHEAQLATAQERVTRREATSNLLTAEGKNWVWLEQVAGADYPQFLSGELQLVKVEDPSDPQKRAISHDVLRRNKAFVAVSNADFLNDRRLPPAAKSVDPYAMSAQSLRQWKQLLENGLSYDDLKNSDIQGMGSFLAMTGALDRQGMGECETLRKALEGLSAEERASITGNAALLRERVTAYENNAALRAIYRSVYSNEDDFDRMAKDALNRMFKSTVVDDIFSGKNPLGSVVEAKFREHLIKQKRCADNIIQNETKLQALYLKFHREFDGAAFKEWAPRILNQYRTGLGDQVLIGEVEIDPGTLGDLEKILTPTEEDLAAILRAERFLKWVEMENDPADFPG